MSDVSGANIRLGATADGAISTLDRLRQRFALFSREVNKNVTQNFRQATDAAAEYRKGLTQLGDKLTSIGQTLALFVTLPALFGAQQAYKDYANVQRLERGLAQYGETLEKVRRLAKEPNIGVFDGAKALIGLRAARIEAGLAERAVRSFANAITLGGGSSVDLEPALFNLKQFKATQHINQVDLRQLANRIPQTMEALERAFGTTDTEKLNQLGIDKFLEGFISELEKLPKVAGGASVAMEQLSDSATFFSAAFGEGLDRTFNITDKISNLGGFLDNLTTNFKALNPEGQKSVVWFASLSVIIPGLLIAIGAAVRAWAALAVAAKLGIAAMTAPQFLLVASVLAGIGLAIGGVVTSYKLLTNETAEFKRVQDEVNNLAPKIQPLLDKYDGLKKNAGDSTEKQRELKTVIQQIAELVPSAVTQWDEYGRAIDINKDKVKSFTAEMHKALAAMAPMRRGALVNEIDTYRNRQTELQRQLREGTRTVSLDNGRGFYTQQTVKMTYSELKQAAVELQQVSAAIAERQKEIVSLGSKGVVKEVDNLKRLEAERNKAAMRLRDLLRTPRDDRKPGFGRMVAQATDQVHDLDEQLEKAEKATNGLVREWNTGVGVHNRAMAASKKSVIGGNIPDAKLGEMSVDQLEDKIKSLTEAYTALNPAQKDYTDQKAKLLSQLRETQTRYEALKSPIDAITKKTRESTAAVKSMTDLERRLYLIDLEKKHLETAAAIKRETREYKELVGVISNFNIKAQESRNVLTGRLSGVRLRDTWVSDAVNYFGGPGGMTGVGMSAAAAAQVQAQRAPVNTADRIKANEDRLKAIGDSGTKGLLKNMKSERVEKDALSEAFATINQKAGESDEAYNRRVQSIVRANQELTQSIKSSAAEAGVAVGELFGDLINGENPLENFKARVLSIIGSLLKDLGKSLIALGLAGEAFKFFKDKPGLAFAAGIALTAAGAAASNAAQKKVNAVRLAKGGAVHRETPAIVGDNPGARFDPEIVAPYSKVHNSLRQSVRELAGQNGLNGGTTRAEVVVRGTDFVFLIEQVQASRKGLRAHA